MVWKVSDIMSQRREFVTLALHRDANKSELCRRFGITPKTGYKWIGRYREQGEAGLADRSRRPQNSPRRTSARMEEKVVSLRRARQAWGGRKICRRLEDMFPGQAVPAPSTITNILRRHGQIDALEGAKHKSYERFEHDSPNGLWQMDFKGRFALASGSCHALTVLDDHSRFSLALKACGDERTETVRSHLVESFRLYGLPSGMLMDNGSPWGNRSEHPWTPLGVWLLQLGISVVHGRPYHPQTQGKDERFHRTLEAEVLRYERFGDLEAAQRRFDAWRDIYNLERPHEALALATPASRYVASPRPYPETLPPIEYGPDDQVRKVQSGGLLCYGGRVWRVAKAFRGQPVALRPTGEDGLLDVFFCARRIGRIDLRMAGQDAKSGDHEMEPYFPEHTER
jgi:transposase InsO family protein